jgi:formylglycine-generating enzyme required for sulfatase activity
MFEDPRRALTLVDQLRRGIRDGNDLYVLGSTAAAVGRQAAAAGLDADDLRPHLYNHVPRPPEELFRWIETPLDGRIELWPEIPRGAFRMGSPNDEDERWGAEGPQHQVTFRSPFRMAVVPVTNAQYAAFDPDHPPWRWKGIPESELPSHPVVNVTWLEAMAFCEWLGGCFEWARGARLPTEEEWEYACRAGTETRFWSGDGEGDLARVGWYGKGSRGRTHAVGEKPANPWGLYDVHGNAWEWTLSPWTDDYSSRKDGVEVDPSAVDVADLAEGHGGGGRVIRGGGYWDAAQLARSAYRFRRDPGDRGLVLGFRVLLPAAPSS